MGTFTPVKFWVMLVLTMFVHVLPPSADIDQFCMLPVCPVRVRLPLPPRQLLTEAMAPPPAVGLTVMVPVLVAGVQVPEVVIV